MRPFSRMARFLSALAARPADIITSEEARAALRDLLRATRVALREVPHGMDYPSMRERRGNE